MTEELTLEEATCLVNGYANLTAIWVHDARQQRCISDLGKADHSVIYLEKLGEIVADLWDIWNRTTHRYPILRPVIRRMGATMLCFLQDIVAEDKTLDDDTQWDVQVLIAHTSCKMEERMNLPPRKPCYRDPSVRCHSFGVAGVVCDSCEHGYPAEEAKTAEEVSDTEEGHAESETK